MSRVDGYVCMNDSIAAPLTAAHGWRTPCCFVVSAGLLGSAVQRVSTTFLPSGKPAPSASVQGAAMNFWFGS